MTQHCSKRAGRLRFSQRAGPSLPARGDAASGARGVGAKLSVVASGAGKRRRRVRDRRCRARGPQKRPKGGGGGSAQAARLRSHRAATGGEQRRERASATKARAARLHCVIAADRKTDALEMFASRLRRREGAGTGAGGVCNAAAALAAAAAAPVPMAQDGEFDAAARRELARRGRRSGDSALRRAAASRGDGKLAATAAIVSGSLGKKGSFQWSQNKQMQTTRNSVSDGHLKSRPIFGTTQTQGGGGNLKIIEQRPAADVAAKIGARTIRRRGIGHGGGGRVGKTTRIRTIRCPFSWLVTTGNSSPLSGSFANGSGAGSSRETLDAITGHPVAATTTTTTTTAHFAPPQRATTTAARTTGASCAPPMPELSAANQLASTSSSSHRAGAAALRQVGADHSEIQTIIDRLRLKTERARMAALGNSRTGLGASGVKVVGPRPEATATGGAANEMELIKSASRAHQWQWSDVDKSHECIVSRDRLSLCFHPQCSESAAACRGSEPLRRNGNYYYWEIHVQDKIYGTSVMFGLCTKQQRLHANEYCNLVGLDESGWSLSHKGLAWHQGKSRQFTKTFPTNQPITIGLLYNTMRGELSYFMDGKNLGVAFSGLNDVNADLYPVVGSTAKCTRMRLVGSYCGYVSLLERSCFTLLKSARSRSELVEYLRQYQLPKSLLDYLAQAANVTQDEPASESAQANNSKCRTVKQESQNVEDNFQSLNETNMSANPAND